MTADTKTHSGTRRRRHSRHIPWYQAWYKKTSLSGLLVTLLLVALLIGLSVHAGSLGLAHLQVIRVENHLKTWEKAGKVSSSQAMTAALRAIQRAISLHADNPYQLSLKANLLEWRGYTAATSGQQGAEVIDFRAAIELHRRAAELRPLWPESWASLAGLKVQLGELDSELDFFLQQADKLGPYTPLVHTTIVRAGLSQFTYHPLQSTSLLQKHLLLGLNDPRTRSVVQKLVRQYGQEVVVCRWLAQATQAKPNVEFCG